MLTTDTKLTEQTTKFAEGKQVVTISNFGTFAHVTLEEPSEFWEGEIDVMKWTITHDHKRNLPANISLVHAGNFDLNLILAKRDYSSELGNGSTLLSKALIVAYKNLIK